MIHSEYMLRCIFKTNNCNISAFSDIHKLDHLKGIASAAISFKIPHATAKSAIQTCLVAQA